MRQHSTKRPLVSIFGLAFVAGTTLLLLLLMFPTLIQEFRLVLTTLFGRDWTPSEKAQRLSLSEDPSQAFQELVLQQQQQQHQHQQYEQQQQRRDLLTWGSAICKLTPDAYLFQLDHSTGLYVLVNNTADADEHSNGTSMPGLRYLDQQPYPDEVSVRVCWCTDYFSSRPLEFCPDSFDTCAVPPDPNAPVSCYTTYAGDTFVRSFWPVALFWMIALTYACMCSESGRYARTYVRRHGTCGGGCNPHERRTAETDLNDMLLHEPERAAFMYRRYVYRQRIQQQRREQRQQQFWYQCWQRIWSRNAVQNNSSEGLPELHVSAEVVPVIENQPRLELKIKVFRCVSADLTDTEGGAAAGTSGTATATTTNNSNINNDHSESNISNSGGWSLPQRLIPTFGSHVAEEATTLEEMDGEMEHGERCAICLLRLEDGDVVGDLPCSHIMHKVCCSRVCDFEKSWRKIFWILHRRSQRLPSDLTHLLFSRLLFQDCLKDWLKRKNRCPLCQQVDIARFFDGRDGGGTTIVDSNTTSTANSEAHADSLQIESTGPDAASNVYPADHERQQQQNTATGG